ncbi:MAG: hypothetical protein ACI362_02845 [Coriobacteriales bacterium]
MGDFHCPVGAPVYTGEGCTDCKMCLATTKEEVVAATKIVGEYIRSTAAARHAAKDIKKIAVCGKGGAGKSTVTALLARSFVALGYEPLVIDTDDSNEGTAAKLGIDELPLPLMGASGRFSIGASGDVSWMNRDPLSIAEIPDEYLAVNDGVKFMNIGKIENPFQGCSCNLGEVAKSLMQNLVPGERQVVIADQDAGAESFGRGVEQGCDTVVIVIDPSRDSLLLAERMKFMSEGIGICRIRVIMNKVASKKQFKYLRSYLNERDIRWLGQLPADGDLAFANLMGDQLVSENMQVKMDKICRLMLDEAEMPYLK